MTSRVSGILRAITLGSGLWTSAALWPQAAPRAQASGPAVHVPTVVIVFRPGGPDVTRETVPAGKMFLVIKNFSGARKLTFRLTPDSAAAFKDVALDETGIHSAALYDLPPGQYTLSEAGHPAWRVTLVAQ